jgi:hypothetical protein
MIKISFGLLFRSHEIRPPDPEPLIRLINTKLILLFCYFICHMREEILNMIFFNAFSFPDVCYLRKFLTERK